MSTLLVLGGADGALGMLRTARRLGVRTVCVDARADAPGAAAADELLNVSTTAVDQVLRMLRGRRIDGVVSPASDVNISPQFALARRLGLPTGLSEAAVRASVNKGFFRWQCDRLGLPGPCWRQGPPATVRNPGNPGYWPAMVKPSDSSGSRGVRRVDDPARLLDAVSAAATHSRQNLVIVEEFLPGRHFSAESVVVDGRTAVVGVTERRLTDPPYFVTTEHWMPADTFADRIRPALDKLCAALQYQWGALNVDLLLTPDGRLVVGEWGARTGGNGVSELLGLVYGVDANEVSLRMALGERVRPAPRRLGDAASRVLGAPMAGKLVAIHGRQAARRVPGVTDVVVAASPGDSVLPYTSAGAKLGYLLAAGPDRHAVAGALDRAEAALTFHIEEDTR